MAGGVKVVSKAPPAPAKLKKEIGIDSETEKQEKPIDSVSVPPGPTTGENEKRNPRIEVEQTMDWNYYQIVLSCFAQI